MVLTVYNGLNKENADILTSNTIDYNMLESFEYSLDFINKYMNYFVKNNNYIKDSYPQNALKEGLINAIVHRDYFIENSQISINIFHNRIEITSPGNYYKEHKLVKTHDLLKIIPKQRNKLFSKLLKIHDKGNGMKVISSCYKDKDLKHTPYAFSTDNAFTLVLPNLNYEDGIINESCLNYIPIKSESKYDYDVLEYCFYIARRVSEIASHSGLSNSTFLRKNILKNLVDQNYLIEMRSGNAMYYRTNHELVKNDN